MVTTRPVRMRSAPGMSTVVAEVELEAGVLVVDVGLDPVDVGADVVAEDGLDVQATTSSMQPTARLLRIEIRDITSLSSHGKGGPGLA
jgi:hypothetical protein